MLPFFTERFGNPASRTHAFGWDAAAAVDLGRAQVAALLGARSPGEIVFTSGATEANNLAVKGVAEFHRETGNHIVTCATEHRSVLHCCEALEQRGFELTYLPVDQSGLVDVDELRAAVTERTILLSVAAANNEIGTVQPLRAIGAVAKEKGILWHCDAAQAVGKIPLDVQALGADLLSLSAHKIYGPKGVGALYVRSRRPRVRLLPQLHGGGQERNLRSGTSNVPGIVGLGQACALCQQEGEDERRRLVEMRDRLHQGLASHLDGIGLNGHPHERLPGCLNLSFAGIDGGALLTALHDAALSAGAACTSGDTVPSHVLRAIGVSNELAHASLRFGIGRFNRAEEIDYVVERVVEEVEGLRRARVG